MAERGYGVRPRLPFFHGLRQRAGFLIGRRESKSFSQLAYDRLKHLAILAILSLLGAGFEIAVELEDRGIVSVLAMGRKDAVQAAENTVLPVDESPVTIEGENFEATEVEHGRWLSLKHGI